MIFFTTYVTIIRPDHERTEAPRGTPARVDGSTVLLPTGTDVQVGDHLEHRLANDEPRRMVVIDAVHPYMPGACTDDSHIALTCVPLERVTTSRALSPALHPAMSDALALAENGRMTEAVCTALGAVEDRVRALTAGEGSGQELMVSEEEALEYLTVASMLMRRLDRVESRLN